MLSAAIKMLLGDKAKYIGIVIGLSFAAFIISQQGAIFLGITDRTFGFITDTSQPNIWVVDPTVQYIDDIKPLKDTDLYRVKSVPGVAWAVPIYKGLVQAKLRNGIFQTCIVVGIDTATLIGGPPIILQGALSFLRAPDAVIVNKVGAETKLASPDPNNPNKTIPLRPGDTLELNDNRCKIVGICDVSRTFQSQPVLYMTYDQATTYAPRVRKMLGFILAHTEEGVDPDELCRRIKERTGFAAYTSQGLKDLTFHYYMVNTGIFVNFGVAILLGFIIGIAVAGQTFYNFTLDNLRYFGTFKAMGASNRTLAKMILVQALFVSAIGWGIGIGCAAIFGFLVSGTELSFKMPLALYIGSAVSILLICLISALISMRKVFKVDPAIVFRG